MEGGESSRRTPQLQTRGRGRGRGRRGRGRQSEPLDVPPISQREPETPSPERVPDTQEQAGNISPEENFPEPMQTVSPSEPVQQPDPLSVLNDAIDAVGGEASEAPGQETTNASLSESTEDNVPLNQRINRMQTRVEIPQYEEVPRAAEPSDETYRPSNGSSQDQVEPQEVAGPNIGQAVSHKFYTLDGQKYYEEKLADREFIYERLFSAEFYSTCGFIDLLKQLHLDSLALSYGFSFPTMVRELYANLSPNLLKEDSPWFGKIYFRGRILEFSPTIFNRLLHQPLLRHNTVYPQNLRFDEVKVAKKITGNRVLVLNSLSPGLLTMKHSLLFKFCGGNLLPSSNNSLVPVNLCHLIYALGEHKSVNVGRLVVEHMLKFAGEPHSEKALLPFPALLTNFLLQNDIRNEDTDPMRTVSPFPVAQKYLNMPNNVLPGNAPRGVSAIDQVRETVNRCLQDVTTIQRQLTDHKQVLTSVLARLPTTIESSSEDTDDDAPGPSNA